MSLGDGEAAGWDEETDLLDDGQGDLAAGAPDPYDGRPLDVLFRARRAVVQGTEGRPVEDGVVVGVRDGRVVLLEGYDAEDLPDALERVELADDEVLLPGLVDSHVHVNEPGRTHWEGFRTATRAAAAGGTTTVVDMPLNSVPPTTTVAALRTKQDAARGAVYVDVAFWGGAVPDNLDDLAGLHEAGVLGVKAFLVPSGVPEFGHLDDTTLPAVVRAVADLGTLLVVHAEDPDVLDAAPPATGRSYAGFLASRPDEAEVRAVERVLLLAHATGARVHVLHLSSAQAVPLLAQARAAGTSVTVETCPHYLVLDAAGVPDGATAFKCCPPIRDAANADALWEALADGVVDCVVSDHSPSPADLKRPDTGDFGEAWGGISSLQLRLPLVWSGARARGHDLADVVAWTAAGPADVAGLPRKGRIAVGADADLVVLAPDEQLVVDPAALEHRHPVSPYAGAALTGVVRSTWLAGRPVDLADDPRGRLLARGDA